MKKVSLKNNLLKFANKWVATINDDIIASGDNFDEVLKKIKGDEEKARIFKISAPVAYSP